MEESIFEAEKTIIAGKEKNSSEILNSKLLKLQINTACMTMWILLLAVELSLTH